jgi:hypothetical protein
MGEKAGQGTGVTDAALLSYLVAWGRSGLIR